MNIDFNKFLNKTATPRSTAEHGPSSGVCCYRVGPDMPLEQRGWFCNEDLHGHYECVPHSQSLPRGTDWTSWHNNTTCQVNPCQLGTLNGSCCSPGTHPSGLFPELGCYDSRETLPNQQPNDPSGLIHLDKMTCEGIGNGTWRSFQYCDKPCMQLESRPRDPRLSLTHPKAENMDI